MVCNTRSLYQKLKKQILLFMTYQSGLSLGLEEVRSSSEIRMPNPHLQMFSMARKLI